MKGINPMYRIEIKERDSEPEGSHTKYYASFYTCYVVSDHLELPKYGDGKTRKKATKNYCKEISGRDLVFGFPSSGKLKIKAPELFYKK